MIIANLATYPPRQEFLPTVLDRIVPQVDRINLVLNEYVNIPPQMKRYDNVIPILPDHDTKDAGKFYPDASGADYVFFIDDDILYPSDFVSRSVERMKALGDGRFLGGYHCSVYKRPSISPSLRSIKSFIRFKLYPNRVAGYRSFYHFGIKQKKPIYVDQIGSGAAVMRGRDVPSYSYMQTSQKFVDVRLARWCFEQKISKVSLPREAEWLRPCRAVGVTFEETIHESFTNRHHANVADEIWQFAFRDKRVGSEI